MRKKKSYRRILTLLVVIGLLSSVSFATIGGYNLFKNKSGIQTASEEDSGVIINMFDYGVTSGSNEVQSADINRNPSGGSHTFQFCYPYKDESINAWTGPGGQPKPGIVKPELDRNGVPVLATTGESLDYLFKPGSIQGQEYTGLSGLLQKDEKSNYSFDSSKNYAELNKEKKKFTLSDPIKLEFEASDKGACFIPFNTRAEAEKLKAKAKLTDEDLGKVNWLFGMTVEADFVMPKDGQLNGEDMTFEFVGDDDVWVFIDGKLVLDLGGVHDRTGGRINFNTGHVEMSHNYKNPDDVRHILQTSMWGDKDSPFKEKFLDGSQHTIKFFYLERGSRASNCMLKFNLPVLPKEALSVGKYVDGLPTSGYSDKALKELKDTEYTFKVFEADKKGKLSPETLFVKPGQSYDLWEDGVDTGRKGKVERDGTIRLKHSQMAVFPEFLKPESQKYFVAEEQNFKTEEPSAANHIKSFGVYVNQGKQEIYQGYTATPALPANTDTKVTFANMFDKATLGNLSIKKEVADTASFDRDREFRVKVEKDKEPVKNGRFVIKGTAKTRQSNDQGIVTIKDGETLVLEQALLKGSSFTVTELNEEGLYDVSLKGTMTCKGKTENLSGKDTLTGTVKDAGTNADIIIKNSDTLNIAELKGDGALKVKKAFTGRDKNQWLAGDQFRFTLESGDRTTADAVKAGSVRMPGNLTASIGKNTPEKTAAFGKLAFTKEGRFTFKVSEVLPQGVTGENKVKDGITYDTEKKTVTVTVTKDTHGALKAVAEPALVTFNNSYKAAPAELTGSTAVKVTKKLEGRPMTAEDAFTFKMEAVTQDAPLPEGGDLTVTGKVSDKNTASADFGKITFDKAGVYEYRITETAPEEKGRITYSEEEYKVVVTVSDNNKGTLSAAAEIFKGEEKAEQILFTNVYTPAPVTLKGTDAFKVVKNLEGRNMNGEDSFNFKLEAVTPGAPLPSPATLTLTGSEGRQVKGAFGDVEFTEAGTYKYRITETAPSETEGITYSKAEYEVTVTVNAENGVLVPSSVMKQVKNHKGSLQRAQTVQEAVFNNTYAAAPLTVQGKDGFGVKKVLNGRDMEEGETFTFTLTVKGDAPSPEKTELTLTKDKGQKNIATGDFGEVTFTKPGDYEYKIVETAPDETKGLTYSKAEYTVVVKVRDNGKGNLVLDNKGQITVRQDKNDKGEHSNLTTYHSSVFTNTYKAAETSPIAELTGTKKVTSDPANPFTMNGNEFTFTVTKGEQNPASDPVKDTLTVKNGKNGTFTILKGQKYTEAGTYTYTVKETESSVAGFPELDKTQYVITVKVTDLSEGKHTGQLVATTEITKAGRKTDAIAFTNAYVPSSAELNGAEAFPVVKNLKGRQMTEADSFTFAIRGSKNAPMPEKTELTIKGQKDQTAVNGAFGNITYDKAGTYQYTITETAPSDTKGITYSEAEYQVTVRVTDNKGKLSVAAEMKQVKNTKGETAELEAESAVFENTYKAAGTEVKGSENLKVTKNFAGRTWKESDNFTFTLAATGNTLQAVESGKVVMPEGELVLTSENTEPAQGEGAETVTTADRAFGNIQFKEAGTYTFTIKEKVPQDTKNITYDKSAKNITVKVTDNGLGKLQAEVQGGNPEFTNTYKAAAVKVKPEGKKTLKSLTGNRQLEEGEFSFTLKGENTEETVTNTERGTFAFSDLEFTKAGNHEYTISEVKGEEPGITYDEKPVKLVVKVTYSSETGELSAETVYTKDNETVSTAAFENTYKADSSKSVISDLSGKKEITSASGNSFNLKGGEFSFTITPGEDNNPADPVKQATVKNNGEGAVSFIKEAEYTQPGTYTYTVEEQEGTIKGISYDKSRYVITVKVTDQEKGNYTGELKVSQTVTKNGEPASEVKFTNEYNPSAATLNGMTAFPVVKNLEGRKMTSDDRFNFKLTGEEGAPMPENDVLVLKGQNGESSVTGGFGNIQYTKEGTYSYGITETDTNAKGITYSKAEYQVKVTVRNDQGTLKASSAMTKVKDHEGKPAEGSAPKAVFNNVYGTDSITIKGNTAFNVNKEMKGRDLEEGESFTFTIKPVGDIPAPEEKTLTLTKTENSRNRLSGNFGDVTFTAPGEYRYEITENPSDNPKGVAYSKAQYTVTIRIIDNGDGTLALDKKSGITVRRDKNDQGVLEELTTFRTADFVNTYSSAPSEPLAKVEGIKKVTSDPANPFTMKGSEFTFSVTKGEENPASDPVKKNLTAVNGKDGKITLLDNLVYTEKGTYTYVVKETAANVNGFPELDKTQYVITVKVTDLEGGKHTGKLKTSTEITKAGQKADAIEFVNAYEPAAVTLEGTAAFPVVTNLEGRKMTASDRFNFKLTGEDKAPMPEKDELVLKGQDKASSVNGSFGNINYKKAGTYSYTITETDTNADGMTYSKAQYDVTVTVEDKAGTLSVSSVMKQVKDVKGETVNQSATKAAFTNTYKAEQVTVKGSTDLKVTKKFAGRTWKESDSFTFNLAATGDTLKAVEDGTVVMPEGSITVSKTEAGEPQGQGMKLVTTGEKAFGNITFKKAGTYTFKITETVPEEKAGITYDEGTKNITVKVTDNGKGNLVTEVQGKNPEFTNTYKPEEVTAVLQGTKTLESLTGNRELKDGEFTFVLTDEEGKTETVTNDGKGKITFAEKSYKVPGTYTYTIKETKGSEPGITYDQNAITATVTVSYDAETGKLSAATEYAKGEEKGKTFTFENSYKADSESAVITGIKAQKKVTSKSGNTYKVNAGDFSFTITPAKSNDKSDPVKEATVKNDGTGMAALITNAKYTQPGTYSYTVKEVKGSINGFTYDDSVYTITVKVTDTKGKLSVSAPEIKKAGEKADNIIFTNEYNPSAITLEGTTAFPVVKNLEGRKMTAGDRFNFKLTGEDKAPMPEKDELVLKGQDKASSVNGSFGDINYKKAGTYSYTITETDTNAKGMTYSKAQYKVTVTVEDKAGALAVTSVMKQVKDVKGETADKTVSKAVFTNTYKAEPAVLEGKTDLELTKIFTGRQWNEKDHFDFTLEPAGKTAEAVNDNLVVLHGAAVTLDHSLVTEGSVRGEGQSISTTVKKALGNITFKEAGTYTFTISETVPAETKGIAYDRKPVTVEVTVTDVQKGQYTGKLVAEVTKVTKDGKTVSDKSIVFTNAYTAEPVKAVLEGTKTLKVLTGTRELKDDEFSFVLTDKEGKKETVTNKDGKVIFSEKSYSKAGTYTYTIKETKGSEPGISYDGKEVTATVTVSYDAATGKLSAATEYAKGDKKENTFNFTNTYKADAAPALNVFTGIKKVNSNTDNHYQLKGDDFSFTMTPGENNPEQDPLKGVTVKNSKDGTILFAGNVVYSQPGTYTYTVKENQTEVPGFTVYDSSEYVISVNVTDTAGKLNTSVVLTKDGEEAENIIFTNGYNPEKVTLNGEDNFTVVKNLEGRKMTGKDQFIFQLEGLKNAPMPENDTLTLNGISGKSQVSGHFGNITYITEGTYQYRITEKVPEDKKGITYSGAQYLVTVNVEANENGRLEATSELLQLVNDNFVKTEASAETISFTNRYKAVEATLEGSKALEVTKIFEGRKWNTSDKFSFTLEPTGATAEKAKGDNKVVIMPEDTITLDSSLITDKSVQGENLDLTTTVKKAFGNIIFKEAGEYTFRVKENIPENKNGIAYDQHEVNLTVSVTDLADDAYTGKLAASVTTMTEGRLVFKNTYTPEAVKANLAAEKKLKTLTGNRQLKDEEFTFILTDEQGKTETVKNDGEGKISFTEKSYEKPGTYTYTIKEEKGSEPGITYDQGVITAEVTVSYDTEAGKLSSSVTYTKEGGSEGKGQVFTNTYKAEPTSEVNAFHGQKLVEASEGNSYTIKGGEFKFRFVPEEGNPESDPLKDSMTAENDGEGFVSFFSGVKYTQPGTYRYSVTEDPGEVSGISEYDPSVYVITVQVSDMAEGSYTGKLAADVSLTKDGQHVESIVFTNKYNPEKGTYTITGKKDFNAVNSDRTMSAEEFSFALKDEQGAVLETVKNDAEGNFTFSSLTYDRPGKHTYTVEEVNDGLNGFTYDSTVYTVVVNVTDEKGQIKAEGTVKEGEEIRFTNTYQPHSLVLEGFRVQKNLTGRTLKDGEFSFELVSKENPDEVLQVKSNNQDGSVVFDPMEYVREGKYSYIIREQKGELGGVTYDQASFDVTVNVTDTNGQLTAIVTYTGSETGEVENVQFNNSYSAAGTSVKLSAAKTLNGRTLKDGEFQFVLTDENGKVIETVKNSRDGSIEFETLNYDEAGEYVYYVTETPGNERHMTYDDSRFRVVVSVTDNEAGSLVPEIHITKDDTEVKTIGFVNAYNAPLPEQKPQNPQKPDSGNTVPQRPSAPLTGDSNDLAGAGLLALLSAAVLTAGRRKEKQNH